MNLNQRQKNMMRNIFRPFIASILIAMLFTFCSPEKPESKKVFIKGEFPGYDGKLTLSKVTSNNVKVLDSADLSTDKTFSFKVNAPDYSVFRLTTADLYPLMVILKAGDTVNITGTDDTAWPFRVQGPEECMLLADYLERLNRDHYAVDSLSVVFHNSQGNADFLAIRKMLNNKFIELHEGHKAYARQFVTTHPSSIASIIVLNGFFKEFALFHQHNDFNYYEIVDAALTERFPENKYVLDFHSQVENIRAARDYELETKMRLSPGRMVPEFQLPSASSEQIGPQDLKGNSILIYFWAAADAKSRKTNPMIRKAYDAYHTYGLEVLAISFDKDPNIWKAAIQIDSLPGIHVSDLKGAGSPVQKLFNLKMQLPVFFLIDTRGRIFKHSKDFSKLHESIIDLYNQKPDY